MHRRGCQPRTWPRAARWVMRDRLSKNILRFFLCVLNQLALCRAAPVSPFIRMTQPIDVVCGVSLPSVRVPFWRSSATSSLWREILVEIPLRHHRPVITPWSTGKGETRKVCHILSRTSVTQTRRQMSTHVAVALLDLTDPRPETMNLCLVGARIYCP